MSLPLHYNYEKRGEDAALLARVEALRPRLIARAVAVLHDPARAEDVVQELTLKLWQHRADLPAEEPAMQSYLLRAATNAAINELRGLVRRRRTEKLAARPERKPEVEPNEAALQAWELASRLPGDQREVLELRYLDGLSLRETAAKLGMPEGTVSTRQRNGLQALRAQLAAAGSGALSVAMVAAALGTLWKTGGVAGPAVAAAGGVARGWLWPVGLGGAGVAVAVIAAVLLTRPAAVPQPQAAPVPVASRPTEKTAPRPVPQPPANEPGLPAAVPVARAPGPVTGAYIETLRLGGETDVARLDLRGFKFVVHGFVEPLADGSLRPSEQFTRYCDAGLAKRVREHGSVPVVGIGGATFSAHFGAITASPAAMDRFLADLGSYLRQGYGGVEINWQYPTTSESGAVTALLSRVRDAARSVDKDALVLFSAGSGYWLDSYDWPALAPLCDYALVCGFNWNNPAGGPVRNPGALMTTAGGKVISADVTGALQVVLGQGFPRDKLLCGVAFFGSDGSGWQEQSAPWQNAAIHAEFLEVKLGGAWWNTPASLHRKLDALEPLAGGFCCFELGHEDPAVAELSRALRGWRR
ncbi:MAG: sigma-70 family RNA polymerase sigma factor [Planctomycetes bacterium]|nr:sigma-70 family RNA polymerase sigma factor [Planctomycetota bacterium]